MTSLIIGSRQSTLATIQATMVGDLIQKQHPDIHVVYKTLQTTGDRHPTQPLSEIGGKSVFVKEIEKALVDTHIDLAVHSLKDMTCHMLQELTLLGFLNPESVCDTLVSLQGYTLDTLPMGANIGTGSLRRKAFLKELRPDVTCIPLRGNVDSRLAALYTQPLDGIVLSEAGLIRIQALLCSKPSVQPFIYNTSAYHACRLEPHVFCPAPGQGVVAIQGRVCDKDRFAFLSRLCDPVAYQRSVWEYQLLHDLAFNCTIPFGAMITGDGATFCAQAALPNKRLSVCFDCDNAHSEIFKFATLIKEAWS